MIKKQNWHLMSVKDVLKELNTDAQVGLNSEAVLELQKKYGENTFTKKNDWGLVGKILIQFKSPLIFVLLAAGFVTIFLREYTDSLVIFLALLINTAIGTFQENKASQAFDKLNKSQSKFATVIRDGKKSIIPVRDITLGDLVILSPGVYIPADIRLIQEKNLLVNESVLTGEWVDVTKNAEEIKDTKNTSINSQTNMVWMGTLISAGNGLGIVTGIGDKTEIGKIAESLNSIEEEETPIKENMRKLSHFLTIVVIISLVVIFFLGLFRGNPVLEMILIAVAVAVATMPSGLPAAVTAVLAVGMNQILKKGGLVRNLVAAETLGSTTIILSDKTGTITEAKMHLSEVYTAEFIETKDKIDDKELVKLAVLSSDAFIDEEKESPNKLIVRGRPLEKAIVLAGIEYGFTQVDLFNDNNRIDLMSFESKNGYSASLNESDKNNLLLISGIPELILENVTHVFRKGEVKKMTDDLRDKFIKLQNKKSEEGMRFTALAYKKTDWKKIPENGENKTSLDDLIFVGLLAFSDPIRPDAKLSIKEAEGAGARVIMITGDNPNTAGKIAQEVGIIKAGDKVLTGSEVEKMKDAELLEVLKTVKVFSRMKPSQKLRISKILQKNGEVVAMTGDGINDAPALQGADIGIAMGSGTEVAKEASDLILIDGNFSVITYAIKEGRRIIDNLRKIIGYLLSTSFTEVFVIGGALVAGFPLPILPTQILWANIVEEGLMNFAFVFEPAEKDLMKRDPRSIQNKNILTKELKAIILIVGVTTGTFLMLLYWLLMQTDMPIEEARTIMFVATSIESIFFALSFKSLKEPLWKEDLFSNRYLIFALIVSIGFLLIAMFFPPIQKMLSLTVLTGKELLMLGAIGIFNLFVIEMTKHFVFKSPRFSN